MCWMQCLREKQSQAKQSSHRVLTVTISTLLKMDFTVFSSTNQMELRRRLCRMTTKEALGNLHYYTTCLEPRQYRLIPRAPYGRWTVKHSGRSSYETHIRSEKCTNRSCRRFRFFHN